MYRIAALALLAAGCSQTHESVGTGIYDLMVAADVEQCAPSRATGPMGPVAVVVADSVIDAPVPDMPSAPLTAPRIRLRADNDFHAETNQRLAGCDAAYVHEEWTLTEGNGQSFDLLHTQRWMGLSDCPAVQTTIPFAPQTDCMSERHLRYSLSQGCESPCTLGLSIDAPSGAACVCP